MNQLVDTHCHIHEAVSAAGDDEFVQQKWAKGGFTSPDVLIREAAQAGVGQLLCVGTTLRDSQMAVELAGKQPNCYASVGIHPHEAKDHLEKEVQASFAALATEKKVVAIGEIGLDYYYNHSPKADQIKILEFQLDLAVKHGLPCIFHVREAFSDFWAVYDQYKGLPGVIHSFSSNTHDLEDILSRGLYVGLNGIMTFTKDPKQLEAARAVPLDRLLLETDAPFLTPAPHRGTICQPKHMVSTAEFLADLRGESLESVAQATTNNARRLFGL